MKTNPVKHLLKTALLLAVFLFHYEGLAQCLTLSTTYTNCICSGDYSGVASVSVSGGVAPYAYDWTGPFVDNSSADQQILININQGTYTVVVYSSDGCMASTTVTITALNISPTVTLTPAVCYNQTATLTASGSSAVTYMWNTTANTASISASLDVLYSVTVTAANGCTASESTTLNGEYPTSVSVSASQTICTSSQTSATLTASNATSYLWNTGATTPSIIVNPTSTTVYTVTGKDACSNATSAITSVTINSNSVAPSVTFSGNSYVCPQGSSDYTASGADTYTWTLGGVAYGGNSSTISISGSSEIQAGLSKTLVLIGTNASTGCTNTASLTINDPGPSITFSQDNLLLPEHICAGNTFTINATISPAPPTSSYTWTPALTGLSPAVNPTVTTTYSLAATYSSCTISDTYIVNVVPTPAITLASPLSICNGTTYTLSPIVTNTLSTIIGDGFSSHVEYNWSPSTNLSSTTTETTVATVLNNAIYTLTVSNFSVYDIQETRQVLVCPQTASVTITSLPNPTVSISGNQIICPDQTTSLTASGASSYTWNTGITSPSITVGVGSTNGVPYDYSETYTVTGANANGCTNTTTITVSDPVPSIRSEAFSVYTNTVTLCSGTSYTFEVGLPSGETYTWTPALSGGLDPVVSPTVSTFYVLSVSNGTCTTNDTAFFYVIPTPTMSIISPVNLCPENSYTINPSLSGVNMNTIYSWSPTIALSSTNTPVTVATPTTSTTYSLVAVNTYTYESFDGKSHQNVQVSCFDTADATINIIPAPSAPAINNISVCDSNYTTLYVPLPNSTYTYTWQGPCFNGTGDSININSIGIYTVTVTNSCGVATTQTVNVLVIGNIVAGFLTNLHFTDGDEYLNSVHFSNISLGTNLTYDWSFGNGDSSMVPNPYETFNSVGVYMVSLFDSDSMHCKDTASATIIFSGNRSILAIPNSFSPNNDNVDDVFSVNAVDITNFSCQISDRWGNLLYQWNGLGGFWNGIMPNGHVFMNGNYYYLLSYSDSNGNPQSRTGIVTLKQ